MRVVFWPHTLPIYLFILLLFLISVYCIAEYTTDGKARIQKQSQSDLPLNMGNSGISDSGSNNQIESITPKYRILSKF